LDDSNPKNKIKEEKSSAALMKEEAMSDSETPLRGKIRRMFNFGSQEMHIKHQITSTSKDTDSAAIPYIPKDYVYIQMRLSIEDVINSYQDEIEEYRLSGVKVRKIELADLKSFVKLYNRAFMQGSDPWSPATEDQFRDILESKHTVVLIGTTHGEDAGFIITALEGEQLEIGVICGLGTDPHWQRKGIGRYLGIAAWDYFSRLNIKELRCEVYEGNAPSYHLIKSLHFEEYGKKVYKF
jgi:ribosomal protein S18 acetylase RimI-like enzyme